MTLKEATIKNYTAFIPVLKKLPLTHRYWHYFNGTYKDNLAEIKEGIEITQKEADIVINDLEIMLVNIKAMGDDFFENSNCDKIPCVLFHDPQYKVYKDGTETTLIENNKEGNTEVLNIEKLKDIAERHYLYGGVMVEYTSEGLIWKEIT